jgi:hypothetical protein
MGVGFRIDWEQKHGCVLRFRALAVEVTPLLLQRYVYVISQYTKVLLELYDLTREKL